MKLAEERMDMEEKNAVLDALLDKYKEAYEDIPLGSQDCWEAGPDVPLVTTEPDQYLSHPAQEIDAEVTTDPRFIPTRMSDVEIREAEWLVPGYIPRNQITIMAGDGGCGKSSAWISIAAALSKGVPTFLEDIPFEEREALTILCFSGEDCVNTVIAKRLQEAGADTDNIYTIDLADPRFATIKFDSPDLEEYLKNLRPALCVFDPLQAFVPPKTNMGARNDMRNLLATLIRYGKEYGTTFLIIMHTNKMTKAWGRTRMADSADMWDIARSVLIVGSCMENGTPKSYLSHEKCNYGELQETVLFKTSDGVAVRTGFSDKKDRDFMKESIQEQAAANTVSTRKEIRDWLMMQLGSDEHVLSDIEEDAKTAGFSRNAFKKVQRELQDTKKISIRRFGLGKGNGTAFLIRRAVVPETPRDRVFSDLLPGTV